MMRLFTAITFDEKIKTSLEEVKTRLRHNTTGGSFTLKDNLHLTVNFIGETNRLELVKQAMQQALDKTGTESFTITIGGFGRFKRREGDIYWIGVERENSLWKLQKELAARLKEAGFDIDDREYQPHLTLGRRVKVDDKFDEKVFRESIPVMRMEVSKISLMNSERVQGKLVYTEIFSIEMLNS